VSQQEILAAAEVAIQKYHEDTPVEIVTLVGVAAAMRTNIKEATENYYRKLSKIVTVANLELGCNWLLEVCF